MIISEKNIVECNTDFIADFSCTDGTKIFNIACNFRVESPEREIKYYIIRKSFILTNDDHMLDLIDLINDVDEKDLQQIIEFLIYYLEQAHFLAKLKI